MAMTPNYDFWALCLHTFEQSLNSSNSKRCATIGAQLTGVFMFATLLPPLAALSEPLCRTPGLLTLDDLAHKYGSGKAVKALGGSAFVGGSRFDGGGHGFAHSYARALEERRQSVARVMEFGVFFGASILMWRDYFPRAEVVGVDTFAGKLGHGPRFPNATQFLDLWRSGGAGERIKLVVADQSDVADLERVATEVQPGGQFDLIIDDGSHKNRDQQLTLAHTFPLLKPGGIFVLEDIHTSLQKLYDEKRGSNATSLAVLERFERGQGVSSKHMSRAQALYLERHLAGCVRIVPKGARSVLSQTAICWKREAPLAEPAPPPKPLELAVQRKLYAPDEFTGGVGDQLKVSSEARCRSKK